MLSSLDHARTALKRAEAALRVATVDAEIAEGVVDEARRKAGVAWAEVAVHNAAVEALRLQIEFDEGVMAMVAANAAERAGAAAH